MKIWVFGAQGMLGQAVMQAASQRDHEVIGFMHEACPIESPRAVAGIYARTLVGPGDEKVSARIFAPEVIVNCAGAVPGRFARYGPLLSGVNPHYPDSYMAAVNGVGPYNLADLAKQFEARLIQMSTDCVFAGKFTDVHSSKAWQPFDFPDAVDIYGRSKLLGEVKAPHVTVVRGSFIGMGEHGFLHWLLNAQGRIDAWMNAHWNGTSVARMADCLVDIAQNTDTSGQVLHVAADPTFKMTKAGMIVYLVETLDLPVSINYVDTPRIWRVLEPSITTPPVEQVLDELIEEVRASWEKALASASQ